MAEPRVTSQYPVRWEQDGVEAVIHEGRLSLYGKPSMTRDDGAIAIGIDLPAGAVLDLGSRPDPVTRLSHNQTHALVLLDDAVRNALDTGLSAEGVREVVEDTMRDAWEQADMPANPSAGEGR